MRASKIKKTLDSFLGRESWGWHTWIWPADPAGLLFATS